MEALSSLFKDYKVPAKQADFKNRRDELVTKITDDINRLRIGTKFKPITKRTIALLLNKNPFFAKDDGEVELLYKECHEKFNYSKFFWLTKTAK